MRISKRTRPADFGAAPGGAALEGMAPAGAASEGASPDGEVLEPEAAAPAVDLALHRDPDPQSVTPLDPPPARSAVATATARTPVRRAEDAVDVHAEAFRPPPAWPIYMAALVVAGLWALAPIAFAVGYRNAVAPLTSDSFAMTVFALLAVGPAAFVFFAAYMVRQGQKLGAEARRAKAMAEDMLAPAVNAASRAEDVVQGVRNEIVRAGAAADEARDTLLALRDALATESEHLVESTDASIRTTRELTTTLGRERQEMGALAESLDAQAARVSDSITQQARMVAEASEVAEAQLREAEATLSARAADLAAAAAETSTAARTAGEDLNRHIVRLETAGTGVADQVKAVEGGLAEQRTALVGLTQSLKSDHETFAAEAEAHAAKLGEFISQARLSSVELADRALKGGESLSGLIADAAEQFRDLAETAKAERAEFGHSTVQSLEAVSEAAAGERAKLQEETKAAIEALAAAAEETRAAAARHAESARQQVDQLSEAAFTAGQKANQVFEARLTEARALVEQSSQMVDQAGAATAQRLEEGAAAARTSLAELQAMMAEVDERASRLPANARGQIELVHEAMTRGLEELTAQARRTVEEAQAIDAAFQERARRNFEMLGEAVRLMGSAAALPLGAPAERPARPKPPLRAQAPPPAPEPESPADEIELELALEDLMEPAPARSPPPEDPGLRPRLKLTPTATDEEFSAVFEAAGGPSAGGSAAAQDDAEGEAWTWKDLLASIDGADAEGERLQDILGAELAKMGVESAKLLPKARIDEIAAAVQTGDLDGAREVVRRLAPAATRRIARRLVTDDDVKRQVQVYVRRYQTLIDDAVVRDPEGFLMATLLGDEAGRLYLLLDAAAGDMT